VTVTTDQKLKFMSNDYHMYDVYFTLGKARTDHYSQWSCVF